MPERTPTDDEAYAIEALRRLQKRWPATLWLFAANGDLAVMRCRDDGTRAMENGMVDQDFIVTRIAIPCDGGDW